MGKIFEALQKSTAAAEDTLTSEEQTVKNKKKEPRYNSLVKVEQQAEPQPTGAENTGRLASHENASQAPPEPLQPTAAPAIIKTLQKHRLDNSLVAVHQPHSHEAEQFRMLRTSLLFPKTGRPSPRNILVTSALPGEGKSFVSANLAATIAQNVDKHVLLIDADMRQPTIHKLFGLGQVRGLSDYLNAGHPLQDLLQRTHNSRLTILPGGPVPTNPAELLSSRRMAALLQEVKSRYSDRYIIIDSPPPHITSESNALAQFVDGIILIVKFDETPREIVTQLVANFEVQKILGIVANWINRDVASDYGSDRYSKHHYYKDTQKIE